ncbi:MAG: DUF4301 family protein [Bacteroidales bacterium OttesenSCG-928-I14]|jgi:hypothetical protein|nr:DUF4301 family protein [Bacteroidales bacterium OttesenSCG-928-I14]
MLSQTDIKQIESRGISIRQINEQLEYFYKGFPCLSIVESASTNKGIKSLSDKEQQIYINKWFSYLDQDKIIVKFVPASGAASRMFKDLFEFLSANYTVPTTNFEQVFFSKIHRFAFYKDLDQICITNEKKSINKLIADNNYKTIVENLLLERGLNYGQLPKGLILFHTNPNGYRTAMEEHLVEGAFYAGNKVREVRIHFTISPEYRSCFESFLKEKIDIYTRLFNVKYHVDFSEQNPSTDTLALDKENRPFRDKNNLVFRPGGHGALIENLNNIIADIVFIKNIDNVVPDSFKAKTIRYKQLLAGVLVTYQERIFDYLNLIDSGKYIHENLLEMLLFLQNDLCIKNPEIKHLEDGELVLYIKSKLNRPLRVCGMVRNEGEPGGGPFLTVNPDGTTSLQILESSQIDLKDPEKRALFKNGTHFNSVDLVCTLKNYKGEKFDLFKHVNKNTGFISLKSKNGKQLKALELPGLWNGAMSDWNTIFVDVPIETFNPVKTVNDLLRPEHQ